MNSNQSIGSASPGSTLCVTSSWLDYGQHPSTTIGNTLPVDNGTITYPDWTAPVSSYWTYWPGYSYSAPKIELSLSEVMYLREKASEDKKLRKVLKKFAPYIEITVDFPA